MPLLDDIIAKINEDEEIKEKDKVEETGEDTGGGKEKRDGLITYSDEFYKTFKE